MFLTQYKSSIQDNRDVTFSIAILLSMSFTLFSIFFFSMSDLSIEWLSPRITSWLSPNSLLPVEVGVNCYDSARERKSSYRKIVNPLTRNTVDLNHPSTRITINSIMTLSSTWYVGPLKKDRTVNKSRDKSLSWSPSTKAHLELQRAHSI